MSILYLSLFDPKKKPIDNVINPDIRYDVNCHIGSSWENAAEANKDNPRVQE